MELTELLYAVDDQVATITLNRPERMNCWTPTMEAELRQAIAAASADDQVRAIVVTGAGKGFCAGADMGRLVDSAAGPSAPPLPRGVKPGNYEQRYSYLLDVPKPLIAGINGAVAGVRLCIATYCDLRFMASGARLTTAFPRRGMIAEHGIAWMLPSLIGPMNAADLLLSGRALDAAEAAQMGLVRSLPAGGDSRLLSTLARWTSRPTPRRAPCGSSRISCARRCSSLRPKQRNLPTLSSPSAWRRRTSVKVWPASSRSAGRSSQAGDLRPGGGA